MASSNRNAFWSLDETHASLAVPLRIQIFLRWLAVLGQLMAVALVYFWLGFDLPVLLVLMAIAPSVALNVFLGLRYPLAHMLERRSTAIYLAYDLIQLAVLLYLTGGLLNPFALLFLAPVTVSASLLDARTTVVLVALAGVLVTVLLFFNLPLPWQGVAPTMPWLYMIGIWGAFMLALVFIPAYVWRVSHEGRRMSAALIATCDVLAREQRLSALDGLAAAAAHQLGTPLGTIALVAKEVERRDDLPAGLGDDIALVREQAQICRDILSSLADGVANGVTDDPMLSVISLSGLLGEAVLEIGPTDKQVHVACHLDGRLASREPHVQTRPELIYGLGNLIDNAARFARAHIWVSASYSAQYVEISITDDGPGFAPDILARLGEPYNAARPRSARDRGADDKNQFGLGLGYFIAHTLLQRTGGRVSARNVRESKKTGGEKISGAEVRIVWSRHDLEAAA